MSLVAPFPKANWSSPFGEWPQWRKDMGLGPHRGMDFNGLPSGTPIPASGYGRVTYEGWSSVLGYMVVVYYPEARVYFGYCHLARRGPAVGTEFQRGATVALLGNTGSATTGPHLHLTASRVNGNPGVVEVIDPAAFFTTTAPSGGTTTTPIEEDELSAEAEKKIEWIHYMLAYGGTVNGTKFNYGVLPIVAHNQTLIAQQSGRLAALEEAVKQVAARPGVALDLGAIQKAAEDGVRAAFEGLDVPTVDGIVDELGDRLKGDKQ